MNWFFRSQRPLETASSIFSINSSTGRTSSSANVEAFLGFFMAEGAIVGTGRFFEALPAAFLIPAVLVLSLPLVFLLLLLLLLMLLLLPLLL